MMLHVTIRKLLRYGGGVTGNSGPKICALLGNRTSDGRPVKELTVNKGPQGNDYGLPLHLSLVIDNHASVILEIDELTIFSSEGFPLADHHGGHHFLPQLWFTLKIKYWQHSLRDINPFLTQTNAMFEMSRQ